MARTQQPLSITSHAPAHGFAELIGDSPALSKAVQLARRVAHTSASVLIEGETGTGKDLLAKLIHANSPRASRSYVPINCAAIPRELIESELFGFRRGSFTGALADSPGRIDRADGGTLFLDEIGDLPVDLQVKLLRLAEEHELDTVGATKARKLDLRILAATNRDLKALVAEGKFREDLYHRLAVVVVKMPPLRDRREDIPRLAEHFFSIYTARHQRLDLHLAPEVTHQLATAHHWPGNVRELAHAVERLVLLAPGHTVTLADLYEFVLQADAPPPAPLPPVSMGLYDVERALIERALDEAAGNRAKAARMLGITRKTLIWRMQKYGLHRPPAREP